MRSSDLLERLAANPNLASAQVKVQSYNSDRVVSDWALPVPKKIFFLLHVPLEKMFFEVFVFACVLGAGYHDEEGGC
jgi:hypothetical protein